MSFDLIYPYTDTKYGNSIVQIKGCRIVCDLIIWPTSQEKGPLDIMQSVDLDPYIGKMTYAKEFAHIDRKTYRYIDRKTRIGSQYRQMPPNKCKV